jgi:diguanylate cyclase (GGDEF)-like protein
MHSATEVKECFKGTIPALASLTLPAAMPGGTAPLLHDILLQRKLSALFQPIINMQSGEFLGFEGLIRGPDDSPLHSPTKLFSAAKQQNLSLEIEMLCRQIVLETFVRLNLPGRLFLNVSPETLLHPSFKQGQTLVCMAKVGLPPERVVIEITENQPTHDFSAMCKALLHYRAMGFRIAIDDLGAGFSSLRLWSELRPEYIKIDMHFVQGVDSDPVKLQFLKSIQQIAESSGTLVIAEGIETGAELLAVKNLGIAFGQGYYIARPHPAPALLTAAEICRALQPPDLSAHTLPSQQGKATAYKLLNQIEAAHPHTENEHIFQRFSDNPKLRAIPVVENGIPVGLINRYNFIDRFAQPYQRELLGKKPCLANSNEKPLLVERNMPIAELSHFLADTDERYFNDGFIITEQGRYLGVASGQDLLRELTQLQIEAARYANPLTLLPGNVPVNEQIERLLQAGKPFVACYCDLDNFKPYNDVYSYRKGDEMIQLSGRILSWACDPRLDFIGHIGGDDFILLMQSRDWQARCEQALRSFEQAAALLYSPEHLAARGYVSEDRNNQSRFHPLVSLSIGACRISSEQFASHHEVSAAATAAKKTAKRTHGNSLFIEPRPGI